MAGTTKEGSIPNMAQASLRSMLLQLRQMEAQINVYVRGLRDTLGLEGDDWILDLESMAFVRQPREENMNGVGAATSNSARK